MGWKIIEENNSPWKVINEEDIEPSDEYTTQNEYYTPIEESPGYQKPGFFGKYAMPFGAGLAEDLYSFPQMVSSIDPISRAFKNFTGKNVLPELNLKEHLPHGYSEGAYKTGEYLPMVLGVAQLLKQGAKHAAKSSLAKSLSNEKTGLSAIEKGKELKEIAKKEYEPIHEFAKEHNITIPNNFNLAKLKEALKAIPKKDSGSFREYIKNNSFDNAFSAQSDINKWVMKRRNQWDRLNDHEKKVVNNMERLRNNLFKRIEKSLVNSTNPEMAQNLTKASKNYATNIVPHTQEKHISQALRGEMSPGTLTDKLLSESAYKYRKDYGHFTPELAMREKILKLKDAIKKGGIGAGILGGASYLGGKIMD